MAASNCLRSPHISRSCDRCGKQPEKHLHMTLNGPGFWCEKCCPACNAEPVAGLVNTERASDAA